ncbi:MAG TPA: ATP-binding protein [Kouleothrix sp.]|jgi:signal transduction histidine kinase|nr:ATP-binding protein [Kouleothrix sp.]
MRRLLQFIQSHIRYKIIMPYLALTIFVMLAGAAIVLFLVAANAQDVLTNQLANNARIVSAALVEREQNHINFLRQAAFAGASLENNTPSVAAAIASGNTDVVSRTLKVFYVSGISNPTLDFDRLIAFDRNGQSLLDWQRVKDDPREEPYRNGTTDLTPIRDVKRIISNTLVDGADKFSGLIQFANDPQPYFYTVAPVKQGTNVVGGLMIALKIDRLLTSLQRNTQVPITTFYNQQGEAIGSTFISRADLATLNMRPEVVAALVNNSAQSVINAEDKPTAPNYFLSTIQQRDYQIAYSPLYIQNKLAGYFSVGLPTDFQVNSIRINRIAIALIALALALGSIVLGYYIARNITRPLSSLVHTAEAVTSGDLEQRTLVRTNDEVGRLAQAFNQMTEHLLRLYRTSRELGSAIEVQPVLDVTQRTVETFAPGTEVLALIDDRGIWRYRLRSDAALDVQGLQNLRVAPGDPLIRSLGQGQLPQLLDAADEPRLAALGLSDVANFQSLLLTPLVVQDLVSGVLIFGNPAPRAFQGANEPTLMATANMAASVLYNAILFDRVHDEASEREAILKSIGDGVVVCDQQQNIMLVNRTAEQMLGLRDWHIVRRNWKDVALVPVPVMKDMFGNDVEAYNHYQLGDKVISLSSAPVIGEHDEELGEVIILHDMSAEAAVDRAKTRFIERVSHELRTPLTPICGHTEILLRGYLGSLNDEQREALEVIRLRGEQMRDLVNNFVMIASIEANTLITEPEPQDVWVAIENALAPMRNAFLKKGIDIILDIPDALPLVRADRQQLQVILTQLLDNARRYTQKGRVTIHARHINDVVQIDIIDTGPGIASDEFDQLFTRFHRVEGNNSPERGGGLGLAIVRQLVERQGGRAWAESVPGEGSTFSIALLVANEHADIVAEPNNSERSA